MYSGLLIDSKLSHNYNYCLSNIVYVVHGTGAIQRYFESRRRSWRETTDPTQQQRVTLQNKRRKVRARKQRVCMSVCTCLDHHALMHHQLYEPRSKFARSGEEERFSTLTLDCMSEESSSDGGETILVHQPPWRSTSKKFT